jgi:two-component system OmpR family response regulator
MPKPTTLKDDDVFAITDKGNRELKAAGTELTVADLQVLVLVDGFSTVAAIAERVPHTARDAVNESVLKLAVSKLIVNTVEPESDVNASGFSTITVPAGFFSSLKSGSSPEAEGGVSILKQKGYFVRIARRAGEGQTRKEGWKPTILVVDDDIDLQKLIRTYFVLEGFAVRAALKRDDIVIALRMQPVPDLVLLDVQLPDASGFDILTRMRQHPVLKHMPVIMLTAEATREAVLKGLEGGADGYVTKPFEADLLVNAVNAVLGLGPAGEARK